MREETRRLWLQALEDYKTAEILLQNKRYYASIFFSHQTAEKAPPPRTHNLLDLLESLGINNPQLTDAAIDLTPEYTVTRYPDAANGVPAKLYNERIAREHLEKAAKILDYCRQRLTQQ